ncbi:MAG: hypothetical protein IPK79_09055 [Vampirovibrionales bacterium]|nr:hypothetical protein [Vampirovibrionales bacterium]
MISPLRFGIHRHQMSYETPPPDTIRYTAHLPATGQSPPIKVHITGGPLLEELERQKAGLSPISPDEMDLHRALYALADAYCKANPQDVIPPQ